MLSPPATIDSLVVTACGTWLDQLAAALDSANRLTAQAALRRGDDGPLQALCARIQVARDEVEALRSARQRRAA